MTTRSERLGLDAPMSPGETARVAAERQLQRFGRLIDPCLAEAKPGQVVRAPIIIGRRATVDAEGEVLANGIRLVLPAAPRTKKGHTTLGIKQSPAYIRFRDRVKELIAPLVGHLRLPLPDAPMNLAAAFYVDKPGERADLFGLFDGLADALQDAGVVSNDWFFRTADGSRIIFGDDRPRVDVTITRLPG